MGEVTTTRRIGGVVVFLLGCAVVIGSTAQVIAAVDRGALPVWALLVAVVPYVAAVILLALLAGRLARWGLRSSFTNPYDLPEHRGLARAGGAMFVVVMSLTQPLIALDVSTQTRSILGGLVVAVVALFAGFAWPAGRAQRRRIRERRRERGYRWGEYPWSWTTYACFAAVVALLALFSAYVAISDDGLWSSWVLVGMCVGFVASIGWSAMMKRRPNRDGSTTASLPQEEVA